GAGALSFVAALLVTVGVLVLALHLLRRLQNAGGGHGVPLKVLQRVPLGPKQGVALVQVADRVLVVSIAESGMGLLAELAEPARTQALTATPPTGRGGPLARVPLIGKLMAVACLALLPLAAHAQTPP